MAGGAGGASADTWRCAECSPKGPIRMIERAGALPAPREASWLRETGLGNTAADADRLSW